MKLKEKESREKFAKAIIQDINSGKIKNKRQLDKKQFDYCSKFYLTSLPTRPYILSKIKNPSKKVLDLLSIKPTRSLSGVQVIAVMLPPFDCPGKCIYCPSSFKDKKAPQSYTGYEPSTLRAQRLNYDPYKIVSNRIQQLDATGNFADKIEIIFQGSSFTALSEKKQEEIVKKSIDAVTEKKSKNIEEAKKQAEKSKRRISGITFETRPDICFEKEIEKMFFLGGTRVELGVQNPDNKIYSKINRGHNVEDVIHSTQLLKDSAFKVLYHLMPGLPGSDYKKDLKNFKKVFSQPEFKPDMVKFYPCLVIKGTQLYEDWESGIFKPLEEKKAIQLLADIKEEIPKWVRVMRVNRDIPSNIISAGVKRTNIRQLVEKELEKRGKNCACIRCREIGLSSRNKVLSKTKPKLKTEFYEASKGEEAFISLETKNNLFAFLRLRKPFLPFLNPLNKRTALVRELHAYGKTLAVGESSLESQQHKGYGEILLREAERIAKEKFDCDSITIISGLGVREYYRKFGYKLKGNYMFKKL
jgi:elongator complex protein 3